MGGGRISSVVDHGYIIGGVPIPRMRCCYRNEAIFHAIFKIFTINFNCKILFYILGVPHIKVDWCVPPKQGYRLEKIF